MRGAAAVSMGSARRQRFARPRSAFPVPDLRSDPAELSDFCSKRAGECVIVFSMGCDASSRSGYVPKVRPNRLQRHQPKYVSTGLAGGLFADLGLETYCM